MINKLITQTLKPCGLPVYFITRGENPPPCVVFNVVDAPGGFSDDREDITEYTVLLNIYISSDRFVDTTETIRNLMKEAGFIKKVFPTAQWDETLEVFNQPMEFLILK